MSLWQQIEQDLSELSGRPFRIMHKHGIGGGSINHAFRISDGDRQFFVKTNHQHLAYMFEAEARGLQELYASHSIKVPQPICHGVAGDECYFVMSWLELTGQPDGELFGRRMAELHRHTHDQFGFHIDNTIGSTPQVNPWSDDWIEFWQQQRLGYQLELAHKNGFGRRLYDRGQQLREKTPAFFRGYQPPPSLLHGDLWSGNWAADSQGNPVIFDPASYYGDREADLAMMQLFGHPGQRFLAAYNEHYALDDDHTLRKDFYNLYHILNHANLFGSSYAMQAERMIDSLLAVVA